MPQTKVLIVADAREALGTFECWLVEAGGYDVVSAGRFEDAKTYLAGHTPDILLVEDRLAAFNGLQLALQVRSAHPDVRVIVFSDHRDAVLEREAERCGAHYIERPQSREQLFMHLERPAAAVVDQRL
jgi:DNA-binding NtrC family response regulator